MTSMQQEPRLVPTLIGLYEVQRKQLRDAARANERSMSAEIRIAIKKHLLGVEQTV